MIIQIDKRIISIPAKFDIFINKQHSYVASEKLFRIFDEINLYKIENKKIKYRIKRKFFLMNPIYEIICKNNITYLFKTTRVFKGHHYCKIGQDYYDIYAHKDRKYSVYKNNKKIAWWDKEMFSLLGGDSYKIIVANDCDYELVISFCLIINNAFSKNRTGKKYAINIDFGNMLEAKEFDRAWRPK